MNIHETYANKKTVELLLNIGFDWKEYFVSHSIDQPFKWEIPLHIAQKWLREVKGYEVFVEVKYFSETVYFARVENRKCGYSLGLCLTYEEALEVGIQRCVKLIIENNETNY